MDKNSNNKKIYNKNAKEFNNKFFSLDLYKESVDHLISYLKPGLNILDLGCGPGNISYYLKNQIKNIKITGVDFSSKMIEIAKTRVPEAEFLVENIPGQKFKNNYFDSIICGFLIPFLDENEFFKLIDEILFHLKDNGIFYLSFMEGDKSGYEETSFSGNEKLFINYYKNKFIINSLIKKKFKILEIIEIDYPEENGETSREIVIISRLNKN